MTIYFKTFIWKVDDVLGTVLVPGDVTEDKTGKILGAVRQETK